ncbi:MAG: hypothetical protein ABTQ31_13545 [Rhizobiaceae bacterium]
MQSTEIALRNEGVALARTSEGYLLPVLDVTHPRFAMADDEAGLARLHKTFMRSERDRRWIPAFLMKMIVRSAARRSRLVNAIFGEDVTFLDGISTYAVKLGAKNLLPPFDAPMDRKFAAAPHILYLRLRTQQIAKLLAEGLTRQLSPSDDTPLHLINIAGGPSIDSLNALILTARSAPALLRRPITIHVFDLHPEGVFFGSNALAALREDGGALRGLDIGMTHVRYNWNDVAELETLMDGLVAAGAHVIASSEGGLFEYGSDDAIVANLSALNANGAGARYVAGSVTRGVESRQGFVGADRFSLIPRGLAVFAPLARRAGYAVGESRPGAWSDQIQLHASNEG